MTDISKPAPEFYEQSGGIMIIDARGLGCPKPVLLADEELNKMDEGIVEVLVDNEASTENLGTFARKNGFYSETSKENNYWRVKLVKGYVCDVVGEERSQNTAVQADKRGLMLVVGTDTIGKEEELGKTLMKGFFETMKVTGEIPDMIFFLNAGVKLTTLNTDIVPVLKEIESMGVEIFSCGTCLKYYGLESGLKVGYSGTTNHIVEGMIDFRKIVWI